MEGKFDVQRMKKERERKRREVEKGGKKQGENERDNNREKGKNSNREKTRRPTIEGVRDQIDRVRHGHQLKLGKPKLGGSKKRVFEGR